MPRVACMVAIATLLVVACSDTTDVSTDTTGPTVQARRRRHLRPQATTEQTSRTRMCRSCSPTTNATGRTRRRARVLRHAVGRARLRLVPVPGSGGPGRLPERNAHRGRIDPGAGRLVRHTTRVGSRAGRGVTASSGSCQPALAVRDCVLRHRGLLRGSFRRGRTDTGVEAPRDHDDDRAIRSGRRHPVDPPGCVLPSHRERHARGRRRLRPTHGTRGTTRRCSSRRRARCSPTAFSSALRTSPFRVPLGQLVQFGGGWVGSDHPNKRFWQDLDRCVPEDERVEVFEAGPLSDAFPEFDPSAQEGG